MDKKRMMIIAGGALGLAALCCVGVVLFAYFYNDSSGSETRNLEALKGVCAGELVAETAAYNPNNSGTHPTAILQELTDEEYLFYSSSYWSYQPRNLEEAALVVCLDNIEEAETETCEYILDGDAGERTITRVSLKAEYRLIATQTGDLVNASNVVANPRQCQEEETFENEVSFTLRGDFGEALEPLVEQYVAVP